MQRGCALVHGEHVGAGAHVGARVTRLYVANGQDAVEIHGSGRQFPIVQAGPHQGVSWRLALGCADEGDVGSGVHTPAALLLHCHCDGLARSLSDQQLCPAAIGMMEITTGANVDSSI